MKSPRKTISAFFFVSDLLNHLKVDLSSVRFVVTDIEASGAYPLTGEICELAALSVQGERALDTFETLISTTKPIPASMTKIHGISDEMVSGKPSISEVVSRFRDFLGDDGVFVAHHAPFDAGFLAWEFERLGLPLPTTPIVCTSLLALAWIADVPNHKLATLKEFLSLSEETSHRALADATNCFELLNICIKKSKAETLEQLVTAQQKPLDWSDFSIEKLKSSEDFSKIIQACLQGGELEIAYKSEKKWRVLAPRGLVRNPNGDFFVTFDEKTQKHKRYYLRRVKGVETI